MKQWNTVEVNSRAKLDRIVRSLKRSGRLVYYEVFFGLNNTRCYWIRYTAE